MSKKNITLKERAKRIGRFNIELLKLVGVGCEAAAAASVAIAVVDGVAEVAQISANEKGKSVLGMKPDTCKISEGHLWNKKEYEYGFVHTPLKKYAYEMPTRKEEK